MADSSSTVDPTSLAQLLALLQKNQQGTPPTAPNQVTNSQGQAFQLGQGGQATSENPGSSPEDSLFNTPGNTPSNQNWIGGGPTSYTNTNGTFSTAPPGVQMPAYDASSGGAQYGHAANLNEYTPQTSANIQSMLSSADLNQLVQGLSNYYKNPPTAPTSSAAPVPQTAPPPPPTVPNNQVAYTDPSKAVIPGMGAPPVPAPGSMPPVAPPAPLSTLPAMTTNSADIQAKAATGQMTPQTVPPTMAPALADKLQQGTIQPSDITGAGGPLQASTGSGISPGSLPPQTAPPAVSQPTPSRSYSSNPFSQTSPTAAPAQTAQQLSASDPSMQGINTSAQSGNYNALNPATSSMTPGNKGVLNTASDPDPDPGLEGTGIQPSGGMTPQMGNAIAAGIGQVGAAVQGAYKPIKLPTVQTVQQPKPLTFSAPSMAQ